MERHIILNSVYLSKILKENLKIRFLIWISHALQRFIINYRSKAIVNWLKNFPLFKTNVSYAMIMTFFYVITRYMIYWVNIQEKHFTQEKSFFLNKNSISNWSIQNRKRLRKNIKWLFKKYIFYIWKRTSLVN